MSRPRIGLTTYGPGPDRGYNIPVVYVEAVVRAGGTPLLLPPYGTEDVDGWLAAVDGLVLIGGGDIAPEHYDGRGHETIYNLDANRDGTELALVRRVLATGLPTLAICRGMQLLNVALGGTLHPHLPDVVGEAVLHRAPPRVPIPHPVRVDPESRLARVLGASSLSIASWHHQAIDRLGRGLHAVAWAEDGVIEAVEHEDHPHLLAVQWHPELTAAEDPSQQALFAALTRASRHSAAAAA